jgi:cell division septum initiation protein DivIVA
MQTIEKQKNQLLKRFHVLLGQLGGDARDAKEAILDSFGVQSSRDLDVHDLLDICDNLEMVLDPRKKSSETLRRRLMAAIGGWLRAMNREESAELIKAIACQAARVNEFNKITDERLRSLYYAFNKKTRDMAFVGDMTGAELNYLTSVN